MAGTSWYEDRSDTELYTLCDWLTYINEFENVYQGLREYKQYYYSEMQKKYQSFELNHNKE
jgi:hypothetical protein